MCAFHSYRDPKIQYVWTESLSLFFFWFEGIFFLKLEKFPLAICRIWILYWEARREVVGMIFDDGTILSLCIQCIYLALALYVTATCYACATSASRIARTRRILQNSFGGESTSFFFARLLQLAKHSKRVHDVITLYPLRLTIFEWCAVVHMCNFVCCHFDNTVRTSWHSFV